MAVANYRRIMVQLDPDKYKQVMALAYYRMARTGDYCSASEIVREAVDEKLGRHAKEIGKIVRN